MNEITKQLKARNKALDDYAKGCYTPSISIALDSCAKTLESIATRKKERDDTRAL